MNIKRFSLDYFTTPLVIWTIFWDLIFLFRLNSDIFDFITWILNSQIYLVVFFTSFVFSYTQQMLPVLRSWRIIRGKQQQNRWTIPRLMLNRFVMNISLWLSGVLFFAGLVMSFGILFPESISNIEEYGQLRMVVQLTGFSLFGVALYYSLEFEQILKKYQIYLNNKSNLGTMISAVSLTFFLTLSYVVIV